jgi:hypothetical protein
VIDGGPGRLTPTLRSLSRDFLLAIVEKKGVYKPRPAAAPPPELRGLSAPDIDSSLVKSSPFRALAETRPRAQKKIVEDPALWGSYGATRLGSPHPGPLLRFGALPRRHARAGLCFA